MIAVLARSAATVAIASGLVFAVPVASQALVAPVPVGQFVLGAVRAAAPLSAAASVVGPEGTLIVSSVVALGALAYITKDTWMPWAAGVFGVGGQQSAAGTGGSASAYSVAWGANFTTGDAASIDVFVTAAQSINGNLETSWQCENSVGALTSGQAWPNPGINPPQSVQVHVGACAVGSHLVSASSQMRQYSVTPLSNMITWGQPFSATTGATYRIDNTCLKPDGSTATISATTTNPGSGGLLVPSCAAAFGPDTHSVGWKVNGAPNGGTQKELSSTAIPQTSALYPNCVGAGVACTYVVTYNGVACLVGQAECVDWSRREALGIGGAYACLFGAYSVGLALCAVDERVYEPGGIALTELNTDGNPWSYEAPAPAWAPAVAPEAAAPPAGAPGGAPALIPSTGAMPDPAAGSVNENTDCWPSGTAAWNPAEWVLRPVKCALTWAFVPSSSFINGWGDSINAEWTGSPFGTWLNTIGGFGGIPIVNAGCAGPSLSTGFMSGLPGNPIPAEIHPFNACSAPMSTVAATSNLILTAGIAFFGGMKVVRQLGYAFGFKIDIGSERSTFT